MEHHDKMFNGMGEFKFFLPAYEGYWTRMEKQITLDRPEKSQVKMQTDYPGEKKWKGRIQGKVEAEAERGRGKEEETEKKLVNLSLEPTSKSSAV